MKIRVGKDGGDYSTVQAAIDAVPLGGIGEIILGPGVFREKLFCDGRSLVLVGAGMDRTVIEFGDGAFDEMEDGSKRGTFRSYTAFLGGGRIEVRDLTIRNTAGDGSVAGQALAVYADADICLFENVRLEGCQDTLFCGPLPEKERQVNGFIGPRAGAERRLTRQYYKNCIITGDVDFIFGGADAVFDDCEIICNNRKTASSGGAGDEEIKPCYVTAASGSRNDLGFVFRRCRIHGAEGVQKASVDLGRPWRDEARTVFLNCMTDESIAPERFSGWGAVDKDQPDTFYGEYETVLDAGSEGTGNGADGASEANRATYVDLSRKNPWVKDIDSATAGELSQRADRVMDLCLG